MEVAERPLDIRDRRQPVDPGGRQVDSGRHPACPGGAPFARPSGRSGPPRRARTTHHQALPDERPDPPVVRDLHPEQVQHLDRRTACWCRRYAAGTRSDRPGNIPSAPGGDIRSRRSRSSAASPRAPGRAGTVLPPARIPQSPRSTTARVDSGPDFSRRADPEAGPGSSTIPSSRRSAASKARGSAPVGAGRGGRRSGSPAPAKSCPGRSRRPIAPSGPQSESRSPIARRISCRSPPPMPRSGSRPSDDRQALGRFSTWLRCEGTPAPRYESRNLEPGTKTSGTDRRKDSANRRIARFPAFGRGSRGTSRTRGPPGPSARSRSRITAEDAPGFTPGRRIKAGGR